MKYLVAAWALLSVSATGEAAVATDLYLGSDVYLFFRDHERVVRAACDPDRLVYDRQTCAQEVGSAPFALLHERLLAHYDASRPQLEQDLADLFARVQQIDNHWLTLMLEEPSVAQPHLAADIAAAESSLGSAQYLVQTLATQIAELRQVLADNDDADQRAELITREAQYNDAVQEHEQRRVELAGLRLQYIDANAGLFDADHFLQLQDERTLRVTQIEAIRTQLAAAMEQASAALSFLIRLERADFTDNLLSIVPMAAPMRTVLGDLRTIFEPLDPANRTYTGVLVDHRQRYVIEVPRHGRLESFTCRVVSGCADDPFNMVYVRGPEFYKGFEGPEMWVTATGASHELLAPLGDIDMHGQWQLSMAHCVGTNSIAFATCELILLPE